ncbi:hypothetical protein TNCV_2865861 [Trichonephila clavipes]|nr:hypothetical protein TNCV_2865861 [Trichonephila clavipes]
MMSFMGIDLTFADQNALAANLPNGQTYDIRPQPFYETRPLELILRSATTGHSHYAFCLESSFNHHLAYATTGT